MSYLRMCRDAALLLILAACAPPPSTGPLLNEEALAKARRLVKASEDLGQIKKFSCVGNEAYVDPATWDGYNIDQKTGMAVSLTAICEADGSGRSIAIFDYQSGKRLGRHDGTRFVVE